MPLLSMLVAAVQTWTACSCARSPWTWPSMCSRTASGALSGAALCSHHSLVAAFAIMETKLVMTVAVVISQFYLPLTAC